jgi:hypothetical protein
MRYREAEALAIQNAERVQDPYYVICKTVPTAHAGCEYDACDPGEAWEEAQRDGWHLAAPPVLPARREPVADAEQFAARAAGSPTAARVCPRSAGLSPTAPRHTAGAPAGSSPRPRFRSRIWTACSVTPQRVPSRAAQGVLMHPTYLAMVRAYARGLPIPRGTVWHYARRGWDAGTTALDVGVQLQRRARDAMLDTPRPAH